jgi:phosphoglycolate phosphatase-like HAD superfamily hydrolase
MNMTLMIASSLSAIGVGHFLQNFSLNDFFSAVWTRHSAGGVKAAPLAKALESAAFRPEHVMCLADTADGLNVAKEAHANAILLFNDYDEGKRFAMHRPTGAIVSLHELPDAIRFVAEGAKVPRA